MVSALIIQSLFSHHVLWEFPLMEGQIDSYEIVITAFLSNERNRQIAKEGRVDLSWYVCIYHQDMSEVVLGGRTVQSDSVRLPNKLVRHLSPLWSRFLFLSASCLGGDWWGLWKELSSVSELPGTDSPVRVACSRPDPDAFKWTEADDFLRALI